MKRLLTFCLASLLCAATFIGCQKEYSLEGGKQNFNTAQGTLKDTNGTCLPSFVQGTYYNGVPTGDTNFVKVVVNFTTPGTYAISTGTQNGFSFADTGIVGSPGLDTIFLKAYGTPTAIQPTDFTITFDSTSCGFTVNVQDSTGTGLGGGTDSMGVSSDFGWQFKTNGISYAGNFEDTSKAYVVDSLFAKFITMNYTNPNTGDTLFQISLVNTGGPIAATYNTNVIIPNGGVFLYTDPSNGYASDPVTYVGTNITIIITTYDTSAKIIEGTFSGTALNEAGTLFTITEGKFKSRLP